MAEIKCFGMEQKTFRCSEAGDLSTSETDSFHYLRDNYPTDGKRQETWQNMVKQQKNKNKDRKSGKRRWKVAKDGKAWSIEMQNHSPTKEWQRLLIEYLVTCLSLSFAICHHFRYILPSSSQSVNYSMNLFKKQTHKTKTNSIKQNTQTEMDILQKTYIKPKNFSSFEQLKSLLGDIFRENSCKVITPTRYLPWRC